MLWKRLFIAAILLLLASTSLSVVSLYRSNTLERSLQELQAARTQPRTPQAGLEGALSSYDIIRNQINLRMGRGTDATLFITPDEPEIAELVQEITGGFSEDEFWKDYVKLYRWLIVNVSYSRDSPMPVLPERLAGDEPELQWRSDFWRLPVETLEDRSGDCEDQAALLVSMMLNYSQRNYPAWILGAYAQEPRPKAHVAVAVPLLGAHLTIFDISGRYYTPFEEVGGYGSLYFPQALEHWFEHLESTDMTNPQIYVAFSEDFYAEFQDNEEFTEWLYRYYADSNAL